MNITLRKAGMTAQLFEACLRVWESFAETGSGYWATGRTNTCHLIRTIFVAAPVAIAVNAAFYSVVVYVSIVSPVERFGGTTYLLGIATLAAIAAILPALNWFLNWLDRRPHKPSKKKPPKKRRVGPAIEEAASVLWAWVVAAKHRVCPLIEVKQ